MDTERGYWGPNDEAKKVSSKARRQQGAGAVAAGLRDHADTLDIEAACIWQDTGGYYAEASDLNLPVGKFPTQLDAGDLFGNGQPLVYSRYDHRGQFAIYVQAMGTLRVKIYND